MCKFLLRILCTGVMLFGIHPFIFAQNPIAIENALPGNPASEWDISGAGDLSIQGFPTSISVNHGNTINFKVNSVAESSF